jgi:hypothetical protein
MLEHACTMPRLNAVRSVAEKGHGICATVVTGHARTAKAKVETKRGRQKGNQRRHEEPLRAETGRGSEATTDRRKIRDGEKDRRQETAEEGAEDF